MVDMPPEAVQMGFSLTELLVRNTASSVMDRVRLAKSNRDKGEQVEVLTQIINELIEDNNELKTLAQVQQEQLVSQNISDEELQFINETLIPAVEQLIQLGESDVDKAADDEAQDEDGDPEPTSASAQMAVIKTLVAPEMLGVLQLVGFNFRQAIGEPLTDVVRSAIGGLVRGQDTTEAELQRLYLQHQIIVHEVARDGASYNRLKNMGGLPEPAEKQTPKQPQNVRRKR